MQALLRRPAAAGVVVAGAGGVFYYLKDSQQTAEAGGSIGRQGEDEEKFPLRIQGQSAGPVPPRKGQLTFVSAARCTSNKKSRGQLQPPVRHDCGEDAFFLAQQTAKVAHVGLADGVGGWAEMGVDPALFAWDLMNRCEEAALAQPTGWFSSAKIDPKQVLTEGYNALVQAGSVKAGSSTACLASLTANGNLEVANLGDSGAMLVRGGNEVVVASTEQQHRFNCPYQLSVAPPEERCLRDPPSVADTYKAQAQENDILVLGTDGFFDNVWRGQALEVIAANKDADPDVLATRLVELGYEKAHSGNMSPFGSNAMKAGQMAASGGKPDDITVVVARVARAA